MKIIVTLVCVAVMMLGYCITPGMAQETTTITLPTPDHDGGQTLMKCLANRQSLRGFSSEALPPQTLSNLLWAANGINRPDSGRRTAPSAKNWQEIDIYVAMASGLYLYDPTAHALDQIMPEDIREFTGLQSFTQDAPANLIYVADFAKMQGTPRDQQEFYSATDTGFISQNVYLFCASKGLATVVLGWVDKPALAKHMGLPADQRVILTQPVGYPAE